MKSIKKFACTTAGIAVLALGSVAAAPAAVAAPSETAPAATAPAVAPATEVGPTAVGKCSANSFCFYISQNFYIPSSGNPFGYRLGYAAGSTRGGFASQPAAGGGTFANNVESVDNNTGYRICLYNASSNFVASVNPGAERATLGAANNITAGWRAVTTASCPPHYIDA